MSVRPSSNSSLTTEATPSPLLALPMPKPSLPKRTREEVPVRPSKKACLAVKSTAPLPPSGALVLPMVPRPPASLQLSLPPKRAQTTEDASLQDTQPDSLTEDQDTVPANADDHYTAPPLQPAAENHAKAPAEASANSVAAAALRKRRAIPQANLGPVKEKQEAKSEASKQEDVLEGVYCKEEHEKEAEPKGPPPDAPPKAVRVPDAKNVATPARAKQAACTVRLLQGERQAPKDIVPPIHVSSQAVGSDCFKTVNDTVALVFQIFAKCPRHSPSQSRGTKIGKPSIQLSRGILKAFFVFLSVCHGRRVTGEVVEPGQDWLVLLDLWFSYRRFPRSSPQPGSRLSKPSPTRPRHLFSRSGWNLEGSSACASAANASIPLLPRVILKVWMRGVRMEVVVTTARIDREVGKSKYGLALT